MLLLVWKDLNHFRSSTSIACPYSRKTFRGPLHIPPLLFLDLWWKCIYLRSMSCNHCFIQPLKLLAIYEHDITFYLKCMWQMFFICFCKRLYNIHTAWSHYTSTHHQMFMNFLWHFGMIKRNSPQCDYMRECFLGIHWPPCLIATAWGLFMTTCIPSWTQFYCITIFSIAMCLTKNWTEFTMQVNGLLIWMYRLLQVITAQCLHG